MALESVLIPHITPLSMNYCRMHSQTHVPKMKARLEERRE